MQMAERETWVGKGVWVGFRKRFLNIRRCAMRDIMKRQFSLTFDEMITQVDSFLLFLQPEAQGVDVMKRTQDEYSGQT